MTEHIIRFAVPVRLAFLPMMRMIEQRCAHAQTAGVVLHYHSRLDSGTQAMLYEIRFNQQEETK